MARIQNDRDEERLVAGRMASSMVASCSLLSKRTPLAIGFSNAAIFRDLLRLTTYHILIVIVLPVFGVRFVLPFMSCFGVAGEMHLYLVDSNTS